MSTSSARRFTDTESTTASDLLRFALWLLWQCFRLKEVDGKVRRYGRNVFESS